VTARTGPDNLAQVVRPPLTAKTLARYLNDVKQMTAQLENSQHHAAADRARQLQRELERELASRTARGD
jgi:hypothetical protein